MPEILPAAENLLDPRVLAKISNMALLARSVVEGTLMGLHKSPTKGSSIEFAEHKPYAPGNEIRHIDWKVYGKSEKYYVKQYEEETNLRAWLLVDGSGSMGYAGGDRVTKLAYGKMVAASLAYLLLGQSDAVGLAATSNAKGSGEAPGEAGRSAKREPGRKEAAMLPARASSSHLTVICDALAKLSAGGDTQVTGALEKLAENVRRRSLVVVISDLLEDPDVIGRTLRRLSGRKLDVIVFHLQDPDEVEFPFRDPTKFVDMEGPREVLADPRAIRQAYREAMAEHLEALKTISRAAGIDYHRITNDQPLDQVLIRFLGWREKIAGGA